MDERRAHLNKLATVINKIDQDINYLLIVAIIRGSEEDVQDQHNKLYEQKLTLLAEYVQVYQDLYPNVTDPNSYPYSDN